MPPESIDIHDSEAAVVFVRDSDFHGSPSIVD
jgi:hypothetical protein